MGACCVHASVRLHQEQKGAAPVSTMKPGAARGEEEGEEEEEEVKRASQASHKGRTTVGFQCPDSATLLRS